ncbi:hypothetical protein QTP70_013555 [Hemibagrus guttatus]|uniref:CCHC-type domain-containing protein n=1 Tax=Hemibagrus guttatus TaxID=175788 RepID=A0AAE0PSF0_9TELE|nr:hypothetical protein QTP70_013555 [Hemibagrus guttatus]
MLRLSPTQLHTSATPHPPPLTPLTIKEEEVNRLFKRLNTRKASGPDSVSPSLLKHCANQLSPVFTDIFNTSLETCHVPACFKTSAIVPVPKKTKITGLNDYRPVALTSVVMKSFERLVLSYLKDITDPLLDPLQFAYRANRSVDDAVNMALHFILQHLDSPRSYARILFVDFSSAFNTIIPALLRDKLFQLNVPDSMCSWITDFLTDRRQFLLTQSTCHTDLIHPITGPMFLGLVYMVLNNGVEELDLAMKFGVDGFDYTVFVTTDSGMKCFNCDEKGHLICACPEKVKTDGATDRQAEQTRPKVCSGDTKGDGPSVLGSPAAESVPADHPAAKPVAAASSMLDSVVTVPPAVETGLSGGNPGATVAKPAGDKAGTFDPAKSGKELSEPTSEPPVQISQVEELESSLDVDFKDNGDSDAEMEAEPVF